ncbi:MAG: hypothetical protein IT371_09990 [Deltaproteobacteria bacterium]|nr:hypothetical protein [Deltaproteobacteria bacterium]
MKRALLLAALSLLVVAGVVRAQPLATSMLYLYVISGMWVTPTGALATSPNKVRGMLGASGAIDFTEATTGCSTTTADGGTATLTVESAQAGDPCVVGAPSTGGAADSTFSCYVSAANTVTVKHCTPGTAVNPASATFFVRVISSQ